MGKCISKPVAVDPPAEKPNKDDHAAGPGVEKSPPAAVAATPAKGSDRSLQQLFAKDVEVPDEDEENGQLKRIPEEDSSAEEQEEETAAATTTHKAVESGVLESIAEDTTEGSGNAGVVAPGEIDKRELVTSDPTVPDGAVKGAEAPPLKVEHVEAEERPSTPEISESGKSPPAAEAPREEEGEEGVSPDSGSEQVDEKNVDLVTQESDKFELDLKPQVSEKFEIEIFGGAAGSGQGQETSTATPGKDEVVVPEVVIQPGTGEDIVASPGKEKKAGVPLGQDEAGNGEVASPGKDEAGNKEVLLPGHDEAGNKDEVVEKRKVLSPGNDEAGKGVAFGEDDKEVLSPGHDEAGNKDEVAIGKDKAENQVLSPGEDEAGNKDEVIALAEDEAGVVPPGKNEGENVVVPPGEDEGKHEAGNEEMAAGKDGNNNESKDLTSEPRAGGDTDIAQKVEEDNVDTSEAGASEPRSMVKAAESSNKVSSEKDSPEKDEQSKEESGRAADVQLEAGELQGEPSSADSDASVNAGTAAAQGQEEVKPEEFFEASEQIADLSEGVEPKAEEAEVEAVATPGKSETKEDTARST